MVDNILIVDTQHLSNISNFKQFYLIGKLGESLPLKVILCKCISENSLVKLIVDMGNSFRLIKYSNAMDCNKV